MKFDRLHIDAFRSASLDLNPLHLNDDYAKRSQFGRLVVYGMAAVLYGLGAWAKGRSFKFHRLSATFRKPLFVGEDYECRIEEKGNEVSIAFGKGPVDYLDLTFEFEPYVAAVNATALSPSVPQARSIPSREPLVDAQVVRYCPNSHAWPLIQEAFRLNPQSIPALQFATLLWASYHVGMVMPGEQALFAQFEAEFSGHEISSSELELNLDAAEFDELVNLHSVQGRGRGITSLRIAAFRRPFPVDFPLSSMPAFPDGARPLQDKVVFISGATRGFGAAMARMCALAGARLALNYRGDVAAAQALCDELQMAGAESEAFAADMTDAGSVARMAAAISVRFGKLDLIVNNAAPPIRDLLFLEQDTSQFVQFVERNLAITLETARHMIQLLSPGGQFLHISTKYLAQPVRGFAHYLSAKAAQEALIQALALEFSDCEFIVARLPRILTDQTNLAFDFDPPVHPGEVAAQAILALGPGNAENNFRSLNLFEMDES